MEQDYKNLKYSKLAAAIVLDVIGMLTFLLPGIGELGDFAWAPIAAIANFALFGGITGTAGGIFTLAEEILPGTDFIPSLTLTWIYKHVVRDDASFADFAAKRQRRKEIVKQYSAS